MKNSTGTLAAMRMRGLLAMLPLAAFALAQTLTADTVLWYRFEEHEPGYTMTSSDRVTNEVDNDSMKGVPKWSAASAWKNHRPNYVAPPKGYEAIYDPVSGKIYPNTAVMNFPPTHKNDSEFIGDGPHIETPDCEALHLQSWTVEAFVARTGEYRAQDTIVMKQCNSGAITRCNYAIYRPGSASNKYAFQVLAYNEGGTGFKSTASSSALGDNTALAGNLMTKTNFWDHVAVTFDAATRTVRAYKNYVEVSNSPKVFDEGYATQVYDSQFPLIIGAGMGGNLGGDIDEFRISNVALAPSQFLRMCSPNALPETTHYVDFSASTNLSAFAGWSENSSTIRGFFANTAPVAASNRKEGAKVNGKDGSGIVSDDLPGNDTRPGLLSDVAVANESAAHILTNVQNNTNSGYIRVPGLDAVTDSSATVEFFFKATRVLNKANAVNADAQDSAYLMDLSQCNVCVVRANRKVYMRLTGNLYGYSETGDSLRIDDDRWHHLAYVYDREEGSEVFYLDGTRIFGQQSDSLKSATHVIGLTDNTDRVMVLGNNGFSSVNGGYTMTDTIFDEIRITKKALRPCEFLTSVPKEAGNTLAWYSFENNSLANGAYDDVIGAGALAAYAGGTSAFSPKTPGDGHELWDSERNKIRDNFTSVSFAGGKAVWPRNSLLEREDLTVEFFARENAASANAGLVSLLRSDSGTNSTAIAESDAMWSIRVGSDGKTPEVYVNNGSSQTVAFPAASALGGNWRHYAVVFAPSGNDTTVKLYCDQTLAATQTITGKIQLPSATGGAIPMLGTTTGASSGAAFNGSIDEVRISLGEVEVADFLYAPPPGATVIYMR
ncbi:MAG: hypothetical protein IKO40_04375 [Kiritimatiellae bacterium]|nr:hypothetical protein [Kiritimatiellia bacterium]